MTVYALLVGIDAYRPPVTPLAGCRADVDAFAAILRARHADRLVLRTLVDEEATRAGVVAAVRTHLGRAGPGDVAVLYFAGHGSEEPVPAELAHLEGGPVLQTLLLHDAGQRAGPDGPDRAGAIVRPLADKELGLLIDELTQRGGHVAVILDCCHSGDADRDASTAVRAWRPATAPEREEWRSVVAQLAAARQPDEFLPGTLERTSLPPRGHVTLSACRADERAREQTAEGGTRGVFSLALAQTLAVLGPRTTYRMLLNAVRSRVERATRDQRPLVAPDDRDGPADTLFLDGALTTAPPAFTMTRGPDGWRIDGGLVHGLRDPDGDQSFVLACLTVRGEPAGPARVTAVEVGTARVEPLGWSPEGELYSAIVVDVPFPPADVQLDPAADDAAADAAQLTAALHAVLATDGPGGGPSPDLRLVGVGDSHPGAVRLRVAMTEPGRARLLRADGTALSGDVTFGRGDPAEVVAAARVVSSRLAHVVRWERVRNLGDHPSPLTDAIDLELFAAAPDELRRPDDRAPLAPDAGYRLRYERDATGRWHPPYVFAELVNRHDGPLYVAVIDLTDRYRCDVLFAAQPLAAGARRSLFDGRNLSVTLPEGRPVAPGASARDWLQVIASEVEFSAHALELPALDEPARRSAERPAVTNTLERIAARAASRDVEPLGPRPAAARWAAATVTLEVTVPDPASDT